jgi:hypothetical protein
MPKTIKNTQLREHLADAMNELGKEPFLIITRRRKAAGALVDIDFLEDLLTATDSDYLASIKEARADAKAARLFTSNEVFGELGT